MKRTATIATFAVGLLLATAALADEHHKGGGPGGGQPHGGSAPHGEGAPHMGGGMPHMSGPGGGSFAPRTNFERHTTITHGSNGPVRFEQHRNTTFTNEYRSHTTTTFSRSVTSGRDARGFGTRPGNWNNRPRTFDRGAYSHNVTAERHFHYGSYRRPSGWYYRRWSYGDYLPAMFWAREYWLTDWWLFELPIPPYGYEWVRYGDDALLVNVYTGEVLEVEYGVFY